MMNCFLTSEDTSAGGGRPAAQGNPAVSPVSDPAALIVRIRQDSSNVLIGGKIFLCNSKEQIAVSPQKAKQA